MSRAGAGQAVFLSTVQADQVDRRLALAVVGISAVVFVVLAPYARVLWPEIPAFMPIYQSAVVGSDLITAAILCIQFNIVHSRALLPLFCGYLFTALMAVAHALSFPGLFAPTGLIGAGSQSTAWLYMLWHGGFPLAVIAYALQKPNGVEPGPSFRSAGGAVALSLIAVVG